VDYIFLYKLKSKNIPFVMPLYINFFKNL